MYHSLLASSSKKTAPSKSFRFCNKGSSINDVTIGREGRDFEEFVTSSEHELSLLWHGLNISAFLKPFLVHGIL